MIGSIFASWNLYGCTGIILCAGTEHYERCDYYRCGNRRADCGDLCPAGREECFGAGAGKLRRADHQYAEGGKLSGNRADLRL